MKAIKKEDVHNRPFFSLGVIVFSSRVVDLLQLFAL